MIHVFSCQRFQNLKFFVAEATRRIEERKCGGYWGSDYEEMFRSEKVENLWYTQDGNKFSLGKYIDLSLKTHVIGYDEDDECIQIDQTREQYTGNAPGTQTTTYSKYIAIFFSEDNQFNILLNGIYGVEAGIEWMKYLLNKIKIMILHLK